MITAAPIADPWQCGRPCEPVWQRDKNEYTRGPSTKCEGNKSVPQDGNSDPDKAGVRILTTTETDGTAPAPCSSYEDGPRDPWKALMSRGLCIKSDPTEIRVGIKPASRTSLILPI
jgi:hypothetical protein